MRIAASRYAQIALAVAGVSIVVGSGWIIWASVSSPPRVPQKAVPPAPRAEQAVTSSAFHTEQEWIVYDVATTISALAAYKPGAPFTPPDFRIAAEPLGNRNPYLEASFTVSPPEGGFPERVVVDEYIWAPKTFGNFAKARFSAPVGEQAGGDRTLIDMLATPTPAVLIDADRRVSAALTQNMASAAPHEEAALLLGAFALREYAGYTFTDVRPALARITAHLAVAAALRAGAAPGPCGTMAEIGLLTLAGREADALRQLAIAERTFQTEGERAWARALRMRLTRDWRPFPKHGRATLFERITYAHVVHEHVSDTRFLEFLERSETEPLADWARTVTGPSHFSIESGHLFVNLGLQLESTEEQEVWRAFSTDQWTLEALNAVPQPAGVMNLPRGLELHVLDWGLWAGMLQRQLAAQLCAQSRFLLALGQADEAKKLPSELDETFGILTLYPIVLRTIALDAEKYRWSVARAQRIPVAMITPRAWKLLLDKPDAIEGIEKAEPFFADTKWFDPLVPVGTGYDLTNRSLRENCERPAPVSQIEWWAQARPFDEWVKYSLVWRRSPGVPSLKELRDGWGVLLEYDVQPYSRLHSYVPNLSRSDRAEIAERLCMFDDNYCANVAENLIDAGNEAKGLRVYEAWINRTRDQVGMSNKVRWVVRHYLETNRTGEGLVLAQRAYEVGSARGMYTYAEALDRAGRHDEAAQVYRQESERYDDPDALGTFLLREHGTTGDPMTYERAVATLVKAFPNGLEHPLVDALPAPPVDGLFIREIGKRGLRLGLRSQDIVVMIDGIRIHDMRQYYVAAQVSFDPSVKITVWRDNRYQQLRLQFPERYFGVTFEDFKGQPIITR